MCLGTQSGSRYQVPRVPPGTRYPDAVPRVPPYTTDEYRLLRRFVGTRRLLKLLILVKDCQFGVSQVIHLDSDLDKLTFYMYVAENKKRDHGELIFFC